MSNEIYKANDVQLRQQIKAHLDEADADIATLTSTVSGLVSDTAYDASWNGDTTTAPSKNAVYDQMELKAPLASPALTGNPTAPTQSLEDNSTKIATTAYVNNAFAYTYAPAMMKYSGSSYYTDSFTASSHTGETFICRLRTSPFTGGSSQILFQRRITTGSYLSQAFVISSDHAISTRRNKFMFLVQNSSSAAICQLVSTIDVTDGNIFTIFASYNASAGTAVLNINGVDVMDTGNPEHVLTTGTIPSGAATFGIGSQSTGTSPYYRGTMGYVGFHEVSMTNWSDFMEVGGRPKVVSESDWTPWPSQPLWFNPHGQMDNSLGTQGVMTRTGTVTVSFETFSNSVGLII